MALVVVEVKVRNCDTACAKSVLHRRMTDLRNRVNPNSNETDELNSKLTEDGTEILTSQQKRQTMIIWIWCRSQTAVQHIQELYESNQLKDVLFENSPTQLSTSKAINIDRNQFKKTVGKFL